MSSSRAHTCRAQNWKWRGDRSAALLINGTYGYTDWSSPDIDNCDFNQDGKPDPGITCIDRPTYVPKYNWSVQRFV